LIDDDDDDDVFLIPIHAHRRVHFGRPLWRGIVIAQLDCDLPWIVTCRGR